MCFPGNKKGWLNFPVQLYCDFDLEIICWLCIKLNFLGSKNLNTIKVGKKSFSCIEILIYEKYVIPQPQQGDHFTMSGTWIFIILTILVFYHSSHHDLINMFTVLTEGTELVPVLRPLSTVTTDWGKESSNNLQQTGTEGGWDFQLEFFIALPCQATSENYKSLVW